MKTFNTPTGTPLYSIEEAIKAYRKLIQHNISQVVQDITVDQALILLMMQEPNRTQSEIATLIFKDQASMTRIVQLMINKHYIVKTVDDHDKRKAKLEITEYGEEIIKKLEPVAKKNRATALKGISPLEMEQLYTILNKITQNCKL